MRGRAYETPCRPRDGVPVPRRSVVVNLRKTSTTVAERESGFSSDRPVGLDKLFQNRVKLDLTVVHALFSALSSPYQQASTPSSSLGSPEPVLYAYHELEPGPDFVNRANLDIYQPGVETYLANDIIGKVGSNA